MLPLGSAIVIVMDPPMTRTAVFVYRTPNGIGWLEPGYFDPEPPARSQWHQFDGEVVDTDDGVMLVGDNPILILDAERVKVRYPIEVRELELLAILLRTQGTSIAEQRLLLASQVDAIGETVLHPGV